MTTTIDRVPWLIDTGILLRMIDAGDERAEAVDDALTVLHARGVRLCCGTQNVAEFWNASTRPSTARSGFGLTIEATQDRLAKIERRVDLLAELPQTYSVWKQLVVEHRVSGKQVHDCRLAALMQSYRIADLLTLNPNDFHRYPDIRVHKPADVLAPNKPKDSA